MYLLTEWEGADLNSVKKHFIIWALYTIHEYSKDEVLDQISKNNLHRKFI